MPDPGVPKSGALHPHLPEWKHTDLPTGGANVLWAVLPYQYTIAYQAWFGRTFEDH